MALRNENPLHENLENIRRRLTGDFSPEEMTQMHLQLDVLDRWSRLAKEGDHHHEHMSDQDHTSKFIEPYVVLDRPTERPLQAERTSR